MRNCARIRGFFQRFCGGVGRPYFGGIACIGRGVGIWISSSVAEVINGPQGCGSASAQWSGRSMRKTATSSRTPGLRLGLSPMVGPQYAQNGDFIAGLELRAAYAILPRLEGKRAAFDHMEAHPVEKIYNISESEDGVEFVLFGFGN